MNRIENLSYADGRVNAVCRAATFAVLNVAAAEGPIEQIAKDVYALPGGTITKLKSSNVAHLGENQFFWSAESVEKCQRLIDEAKRRKLQAEYVLVSADSQRIDRHELANREEPLDIPQRALVWTVGARAMLDFLKSRPTTKNGIVHVWVVRIGSSFYLSGEATPDIRGSDSIDLSKPRIVPITPAIKDWVLAGNGVTRSAVVIRTRPDAPAAGLPALVPGTKLELDLNFGKLRISGTVLVSAA